MSRKTKVEAEKTRVRILASALSLFAKKGYEHTTFSDIARRLDMTKGAVYWHFKSKETLLLALIDMAMERFRRQIEDLMPQGELTFPAVAEMMVENAEKIVSDPRGAAFFKLMKCDLRWSDDSMSKVREKLLSDDQFGPRRAFRTALENDVRAGRVREVNVEEITTVVMAVWDGLVQAQIDRFLVSDLRATLRHSYAAIWGSIRTEGVS